MTEKVKRQRGKTHLSRKHQVTIPVAALQAAHLEVGDTIRVEVQGDGRLLLIREEDPWEALIGAYPGLSDPAELERMRDEWDA